MYQEMINTQASLPECSTRVHHNNHLAIMLTASHNLNHPFSLLDLQPSSVEDAFDTHNPTQKGLKVNLYQEIACSVNQYPDTPLGIFNERPSGSVDIFWNHRIIISTLKQWTPQTRLCNINKFKYFFIETKSTFIDQFTMLNS